MRYVALGAIIASLTICLAFELAARRKIDERNAILEQRKREVQPLSAMVAEVERYQKAKDDLQRHIDMINQLKQGQKGPRDAMAIVERLDPSTIDSIAIDGGTMTINSRAEIKTDAEVLDRRSANGHFVLKVKI